MWRFKVENEHSHRTCELATHFDLANPLPFVLLSPADILANAHKRNGTKPTSPFA